MKANQAVALSVRLFAYISACAAALSLCALLAAASAQPADAPASDSAAVAAVSAGGAGRSVIAFFAYVLCVAASGVLSGVAAWVRVLSGGKRVYAGMRREKSIAEGGYSEEEDGAAVGGIIKRAEGERKASRSYYAAGSFVVMVVCLVCAYFWDFGNGGTVVFAAGLFLAHLFIAAPLVRSLRTGLPVSLFGWHGVSSAYYVCPSCSDILDYADEVEVEPTRSEDGRLRVTLTCHRCRRKYSGARPILSSSGGQW